MLIKNVKSVPRLKNIVKNLKNIVKDIGPAEIVPAVALLILILAALYTVFITGRSTSAVKYSHVSGHYDVPIELKLKAPVVGSQIFYSKDGSSPTLASILYSAPVTVDKTTLITAGIFKDGRQIGTETAHTYFINDSSTLAIISLTTDPKNLWSEEEGIYTHKNQGQKGEEWVKNGRIEFFEPGVVTPAFTKDIDFRVYGGKTRKSDQKSLKICTAENDSILYEIFYGYEITKFKCLLLRNSGGDWIKTMFRDALMQEIISENSLVTTQNYRPAVLFINGEYWGIHNIREHYNDNYLSNKYGGRREDYAILFPDRDDKGRVQIEAGNQDDAEAFYELRKILDKEDVHHPEVIEKVRSYMDIENFFNYNVFELYFGNDDWMENNIKIWRYNGVDSIDNSLYGNDGKFRWMVYDLDAGMAINDTPPFTRNVLKHATVKRDYSGRTWPYVILRRLLVSEITGPIFINMYADMLNTTFQTEYLLEKIDSFEKTIEPEMPRHIERWKDYKDGWGTPYLQTMDDWRANVDHLRAFVLDRNQHLYQHVAQHFSLTGTYKLTIETSGKGSVRVNSVVIDEDSWTGTYFNEVEIELEAIPKKGATFDRWEGDASENEKIIKFTGESNSSIKAVFK